LAIQNTPLPGWSGIGRQTRRFVQSCTTEVIAGDPHQVILDYAKKNDIDMIVMGTHGRTGLDRHLIGSVTEKSFGCQIFRSSRFESKNKQPPDGRPTVRVPFPVGF